MEHACKIIQHQLGLWSAFEGIQVDGACETLCFKHSGQRVRVSVSAFLRDPAGATQSITDTCAAQRKTLERRILECEIQRVLVKGPDPVFRASAQSQVARMRGDCKSLTFYNQCNEAKLYCQEIEEQAQKFLGPPAPAGADREVNEANLAKLSCADAEAIVVACQILRRQIQGALMKAKSKVTIGTKSKDVRADKIKGSLTLLGLSKMPTLDALLKTYRRKALEVHPDRGGSDELFQQMQQAYEIIKEHLGSARTSAQVCGKRLRLA